MLFSIGNLPFAAIEHADVSTERQGRQLIIDAVFAAMLKHRRAKTNREGEYFHATAARHVKVTEFMDGDQHTQGGQGGQNHGQCH